MTAQHRGVVVAKNGVVAASQPLAVATGLNVLMRGGTFADAAIATSAVLAVTEPYNSHLGGDAFLIVYEGKTGETTALNGSGAAPRAATPDRFPNGIPLRGLSATSVPGLVAMWGDIHSRWGALPLADLLAPAIRYAADGFPAGFRYCRAFANSTAIFKEFPETLRTLTGGDTLPFPGQIIRQPELAATLRQIAEEGTDAFYQGAIAEQICRYSQEKGHLFSLEDFAAHRTQITPPIQTTYRGYTIHAQPPVSQGHILLQQLNLVEGYDLKALGHNSPETIHRQVEAKKLAFADRAAYLGDPEFVDVPMETLLSKEYATARREQIDPTHAAANVSAGEIAHDTTYFCVADREGNAVSFIQSVFWGFGCGEMAAGTGILFNNRMTGFSLDPASPNVLAPGKRTAHTLNAYLITREEDRRRETVDGRTESELSASPSHPLTLSPPHRNTLAFVGGTPGGDIQVQSNLQVVCNVIDFGMNPQEAVEAVRWQHGGGVGSPGEPAAGTLHIESRIAPETLVQLQGYGHTVETLDAWGHGSSYQLIAIQPQTGAYFAGSDPRCDGHAAGF